jgi:hypothetical protein
VNPTDNVGLLGCNPGGTTGAPQELINLNTDSIIKTIPGITATDVLAFDPNLNEFFTASQNIGVSNGCPQAQNTIGVPGAAPVFPQVGGILDNPLAALQVACTGQGSHGIGVDTAHNQVFVPTGIFPANGTAGLNSFAGILVFQASAVPEPGSLVLMAFGFLAVVFTLRRSTINN